jgi:bifunctional non-homologous end joining protein LigD
VKQAVRDVREYLQTTGLKSFLRTSGRKGFHVVVPLRPARAWPEVRSFTRNVAEELERQHPDRYVSKSSLKLRPGKIFIDYLRNGRGTTAAASYSLRAAPHWPAALPLAWDELDDLPAPDAFPAQQAYKRLRPGYVDPWIDFNDVQQTFR